MQKTYALITGGSQGIGRAIAAELARRGYPLLLVALDNPLLQETARELQTTHGVDVHPFGVDLTEEGAAARLHAWVVEEGFPVSILVNNAGFGRGGLFNNHAFAEYRRMLLLNNVASVEMTHYFLPELQRRERAHILFTSSMEATLPLPYKAVYTGTKNFLYAFGLALREEEKFGGVKVTVLCPGPTLTNEDGLRRIKSQGKRSKVLLMMPEEVARIGVAGMLAGRNVVIPGRLPWWIVHVAKFLPTHWKMAVLEKVFRPYRDMAPGPDEAIDEAEPLTTPSQNNHLL